MAVTKNFESKEDIFDLIDKFDRSSLAELEIKFGEDSKIKMSKNINIINTGVLPEVKKSAEIIKLDDNLPDNKNNGKNNIGKIITAPLVGTFYVSPSPESEAYVKVGDKVTKGMIICIIEAMKIMNEIECEIDGEIAEVLVNNGKAVEYGQPLFRLK